MVTTVEIAPCSELAPYIRRYVYREFDTGGLVVKRPWFASYEASLHFFFKALPLKLDDPSTGIVLKTGKPCDILGMSSQYNGDMHFKGSYSFFQAIFTPNGFTQLFQIPSSYLLNQIVRGEELFDAEIGFLHERLYAAKSPMEMAAMADSFLLLHLKQLKTINHRNAISTAIQLVVNSAGLVDIKVLAQKANMSVRNFERSIHLATGMSPKLLCCVTRFNKALESKLQNLKLDWTSIAHQSGYFDQMHLIKEFKRLSGATPRGLLKDTFLFEEEHTII